MINDAVEKLIESLRYELQQYGEMLALLDKQQENVLDSNTTGVLDDLSAISIQTNVIKNARAASEQAKRQLCGQLGIDGNSSFKETIRHLPEDYQLLLSALVDENNALLARIHQRARQNHLLLRRSIELIQQLIGTVIPGLCTTVYTQNGNALNSIIPQTTSIYNELG